MCKSEKLCSLHIFGFMNIILLLIRLFTKNVCFIKRGNSIGASSYWLLHDSWFPPPWYMPFPGVSLSLTYLCISHCYSWLVFRSRSTSGFTKFLLIPFSFSNTHLTLYDMMDHNFRAPNWWQASEISWPVHIALAAISHLLKMMSTYT